jgi:hypothetical protein
MKKERDIVGQKVFVCVRERGKRVRAMESAGERDQVRERQTAKEGRVRVREGRERAKVGGEREERERERERERR